MIKILAAGRGLVGAGDGTGLHETSQSLCQKDRNCPQVAGSWTSHHVTAILQHQPLLEREYVLRLGANAWVCVLVPLFSSVSVKERLGFSVLASVFSAL